MEKNISKCKIHPTETITNYCIQSTIKFYKLYNTIQEKLYADKGGINSIYNDHFNMIGESKDTIYSNIVKSIDNLISKMNNFHLPIEASGNF